MALLNATYGSGMSLAHGGHLTHGSPVNFSASFTTSFLYGIDEAGQIDYEEIALAIEHKPKMIIGGFSAYFKFVIEAHA